jgi:hypothetical protein
LKVASTMKHFEARGHWNLADDPDHSVGGTLKFDENGLTLELLGCFREGWTPIAQRYSITHGVVGDSPYGSFVTLIDSLKIGQKFTMVGATAEKIRCERAIVGNCHLEDDSSRYESVELDFSYLSDWVGRGGIKLDWRQADRTAFVATYDQPQDLTLEFGDRTLTLGFKFQVSESTHKATLRDAARLVVKPVGKLAPKKLGGEHVRMLQDLLSFATDTTNAVDDIAYQAEANERAFAPKLNLIYEPIFRLKEKKDFLHPTDMLFTFADSQSLGINIFQNWLNFSGKHRAFCEIYFGLAYAQPRFLRERFAGVIAAFTFFCSTLTEIPERTKLFLEALETAMKMHYSDEDQLLLGHVISTDSELEMSFNLLQLLRENSDLMGHVIEDFSAFVQAVVDTLAFYKCRTEGARAALEGEVLLYAVEKIKMLIKILVLKELGFGNAQLKALVTRNAQFNYLKIV